MHIRLGQRERKPRWDHTSQLWTPGWFLVLRVHSAFLFSRPIFHSSPFSLHLLSSAHFSDSCEHQNIMSNTFWRAAFQNNTQQSFILVTKRTFPWRLPLCRTKNANAECKVTSGSLLLGVKLVCWHWGQSQPALDGLCFPCLSEAAVHATHQPRPHKPWSIAPPTLMFQLIAGLSRRLFG